MPVHPSCLHAWRVQCRNPESAMACPTCKQRYNVPASVAVAERGQAPAAAADGQPAVPLRLQRLRQSSLGCDPPPPPPPRHPPPGRPPPRPATPPLGSAPGGARGDARV
eukprot:COSAG01_NODE_13870_length_1525_cov_1.012623_2_plen_109_part_00